MKPIPTWQEIEIAKHGTDILPRYEEHVCTQQEIDALRQRNAELESDLEKHRELLLHHLSVIDPLREENAELKALLRCVSTNLSKGMSKSIQKLQAKTINEAL